MKISLPAFVFITLLTAALLVFLSYTAPRPVTTPVQQTTTASAYYMTHKTYSDPLLSSTVTFYGNTATPLSTYTSLGYVHVSKDGVKFIDKLTLHPIQLVGTATVTIIPTPVE